jgi:hypothetical protein
MKNIFTEPLLHFLLLGVGLFVLFEFIAGDEESYDENVIVVDKETLLTFVQFRARAFERGGAAEYLDQLQGEELERLIGDYVREEALYRQAVALGVDDNDYVIKRRMIQSIEFITNGFVTAAMDLSEEDIETFFEANKNDYFIAPYMTFTHVYFEKDKRGDDAALALAEAKLTELNAARVSFAEAPRHGDRFPYFLNYVERDPDFVASHFGPPVAEQLFMLEPDPALWRGPLESPYGYHLVLLTKKVEGRYPDLDEVRERVRSDLEQVEIDTMQDKAIQAIVDTYDVRRTL